MLLGFTFAISSSGEFLGIKSTYYLVTDIEVVSGRIRKCVAWLWLQRSINAAGSCSHHAIAEGATDSLHSPIHALLNLHYSQS